MFEDLFDCISLLFAWRWPTAAGHITAVDIQRVPNQARSQRVVVVYEFSIDGDGPYTGQSSSSGWSRPLRVVNIRESLRVGRPVTVRYRRVDPSVNKLDSSSWRECEGV